MTDVNKNAAVVIAAELKIRTELKAFTDAKLESYLSERVSSLDAMSHIHKVNPTDKTQAGVLTYTLQISAARAEILSRSTPIKKARKPATKQKPATKHKVTVKRASRIKAEIDDVNHATGKAHTKTSVPKKNRDGVANTANPVSGAGRKEKYNDGRFKTVCEKFLYEMSRCRTNVNCHDVEDIIGSQNTRDSIRDLICGDIIEVTGLGGKSGRTRLFSLTAYAAKELLPVGCSFESVVDVAYTCTGLHKKNNAPNKRS